MQIPFGAVIGRLLGKIKATMEDGFRRNFPFRKGEALSLFLSRFVPERRIRAARGKFMRRLLGALSFEASPPETGR